MITRAVPETWQALQEEVAQVLRECGFTAETEKVVTTVRGEVELDVFAEETVDGRTYSVACECKRWKDRVPQTVIHAFRTVVADMGANAGYIISLNGFQEGAHKATEKTNVKLVTWTEFQDAFEESWIANYFSPEILRRLDPLMTYAEPIMPRWYEGMSETDKLRYRQLRHQHGLLGVMMQTIAMAEGKFRVFSVARRMQLPLRTEVEKEAQEFLPNDLLDETGRREFLTKAVSYGEAAIKEFRILRDRYAPELGNSNRED